MSTYNPLALGGRPILVTGASSGIGRVIAVTLSKLGARVVLTGRREDALAATHAMLEPGADHLVSPFDLAKLDEIVPWVRSVQATLGVELAGLVHAAGVAGPTPLRAISRARIEEFMQPNLYAAILLLRAASAKGVGAQGSSFVVISSVAGLLGAKGMTVYAATKAALHGVVTSAAAELAEKKIRVNAVAPAYVATPMFDQVQQELPGEAKTLTRQLLGLIDPADVGVAVAYLLSDASRTVTGTTLTIDAGYSL